MERSTTTPPEELRLYTLEDVADRMTLSVKTIWRAIRARKIAAVQVGRFTRVSHVELERLVRDGIRSE